MKTTLVCVIPFLQSFDHIGLTYIVPDKLLEKVKVGKLATISIGTKIQKGIIKEIVIGNFDTTDIKDLIDIEEKVIFSDFQLLLISYISYAYFVPIHKALQLFIPKSLFTRFEKYNWEQKREKNYEYIFNNRPLKNFQQKAYQEIKNSPVNNIILWGVTGSGKTEIYIQLIKDNLDLGKQSLLLIPEILLGRQIETRLQEAFGQDIVFINSDLTEKKRSDIWEDISKNKTKIIVGTRSALFFPYANLGIIIVDEEHDSSYESDNSPRYKTNEIVEFYGNHLKIPIIFASATPKVTTLYKIKKEGYTMINLLDKYKGE